MSEEHKGTEEITFTEYNEYNEYNKNIDQCQYYCGQCNRKVEIKRKEAILCVHCHYRIFYKKRVNSTKYLCR